MAGLSPNHCHLGSYSDSSVVSAYFFLWADGFLTGGFLAGSASTSSASASASASSSGSCPFFVSFSPLDEYDEDDRPTAIMTRNTTTKMTMKMIREVPDRQKPKIANEQQSSSIV